MKKNPLEAEIASLKKSYGHLARLYVENKRLVIRNNCTNALHPFPDGKLTRQLSNRDLVEVNQWL